MNVLSLFDGISCGRIALERAGIKIDNYYSSEIEPSAIIIANNNYPQDIRNRLGNILDWRGWDLDWSKIGIVMGGFPCQAWSIAGKQLGDKDERGILFWTMLDIMKHIKKDNPEVKILIENVKMKSDFEEYITFHTNEALDILDKHLINSSIISAGSRPRYYWTNIKFNPIEQKDITLNDILEDAISDRSKSHCIDANYGRGTNLRRYLYRGSRQVVFLNKEFMEELLLNKPDIYTANIVGNENKDKWRMLTPEECEKIQTLPIGYTSGVSKFNRYHAIGNGWTVDVIAHIFKGLKDGSIKTS